MTRDRAPDERGSASGDRNPVRSTEEITSPPTDPVRVANERDVFDPADVDIDPEVWRQGGPTRGPGAATTTGGRGGPLVKRSAGHKNEGRTAPTTTGDATSGGMGTPSGATTSDATTSGEPAGHLDELESDEQ